MIYSLKNDFKVLYENDSTSNYLVLKTNIDKELFNYQAQMLLHNKLKGFLDFNMNRIGDELNCFYNITSKCTLVAFLSRKYFTRDEFLKTILSIINNIYQLKNYLLYDSNILLDDNFVYVEPDSNDIYFVYLPFEDCKSDIKAFFAKLIFQLVKFNDEYSDNYIQKILEIIKSDNFSLYSFKLLIEGLLCESVKNPTTFARDYENEASNIENSKIKKNKAVTKKNKLDKTLGNWLSEDKPELDKSKTIKSEIKASRDLNTEKTKNAILKADKTSADEAIFNKGNFRIPNSHKLNKKDIITHDQFEEIECVNDKDCNKKNKTINMSFLVIILLQPLLIACFIFIINSQFIRLSDNPKATVIILILIFLGIDILTLRIINEKTNKAGGTSLFKKEIEVTDDNKPLQIISNMMKRTEVYKNQENIVNKAEERQNEVIENYSGETVIIKKPKLFENPYLKAKEGNEVIQISKKSILIGRMGNFVDYIINSSAIGKIHAEILQEGENFYVMDCNSKNGTFLNDNRILPNTKNSIRNNDILRFANREYVFFNCEKG